MGSREVIPSDKLLEYDVTQGYGPLCRFLNIAEASCQQSLYRRQIPPDPLTSKL